MPLSDHEQKLLDQMEQALITEDPRFASTFRSSIKNVNLKAKGTSNLGIAILGLTAGVVALFVGVSTQTPIVGVVGFVGIVLALSSVLSGKSTEKFQGSDKVTKPTKTFMQNLEDRWDNRHSN